MKIVLCSTKDSIRERWRLILQGHQFSIYQASSLQMLHSIVHKNEQYLFLVHQEFMDLQTISTICIKSEFYKVFVLSDTPNREEGIALLQRGVVGYANTYISGPRFIEAVKIVQSGRVWFGQEIVNTLIQSLNISRKEQGKTEKAELGSKLTVLSEREKEIALLVADGMSNNEIGEKLFISERTVKSHISSIFTKTGAKSRLQLALLILGRPS